MSYKHNYFFPLPTRTPRFQVLPRYKYKFTETTFSIPPFLLCKFDDLVFWNIFSPKFKLISICAKPKKMNYEQRLIAAAKCVFEGDARAATGEAQVNCSDYGVTATLKPHQIEGLSWLIRRYLIGVNVILGTQFVSVL